MFSFESYLAKVTVSLVLSLVGQIIKVVREKVTEKEVVPGVYDNTAVLGDGTPKRHVYSHFPNKVWKKQLNPARHYIWWYAAGVIFIFSTLAHFV